MVELGRTWLVGAGNMGGALLKGWARAGVEPSSLAVIDPRTPEMSPGVEVFAAAPTDPRAAAIVLAIKPQLLDAVAPTIANLLTPETRVFSVLAGASVARLSSHFPNRTIVRVMPNLPVAIGKGVMVVFGGENDPYVETWVARMLAPLGSVERVDPEGLIDAATALSGSGPAFVFRFIDALAQAAAAIGLPLDEAARIALATVEGTAAVARVADEPPRSLANRVASEGGATRAGLDILDHDDALLRLVCETLGAAANRSRELSRSS